MEDFTYGALAVADDLDHARTALKVASFGLVLRDSLQWAKVSRGDVIATCAHN